jgi:hypothetical protein
MGKVSGMSFADALRMKPPVLVIAIACGCVIGCGGSVSRSNDPGGGGGFGAAGNSSAGSSSAGESAGGAGGAVAGGAGGASAAGAGGRAQAGTSNGGEAGAGATGGSAGNCIVLDSGGPVHPVHFVLQTNTPVFVKEGCSLEYQLTSACTGLRPLTTQVNCAPDCSNAAIGCLNCGECFSGARAVTPSAPQQIDWSGQVYEFGTAPNGCSCATGHVAAPGNYAFSIDAYLSSDDAMTGTSAFHHRVSFTLPAPNDTVFVDLGFIGI